MVTNLLDCGQRDCGVAGVGCFGGRRALVGAADISAVSVVLKTCCISDESVRQWTRLVWSGCFVGRRALALPTFVQLRLFPNALHCWRLNNYGEFWPFLSTVVMKARCYLCLCLCLCLISPHVISLIKSQTIVRPLHCVVEISTRKCFSAGYWWIEVSSQFYARRRIVFIMCVFVSILHYCFCLVLNCEHIFLDAICIILLH